MLFEGHTNIIYSVKLTTDSKQIISTGKDGKIIKWQNQNADPSLEIASTILKTIPNGIYYLILSKNNKFIYTGGKGLKNGDKRLVKYNLETGEELLNFKNGHTDSIFSLTITKQGKILYSGGADNRIVGWCTTTGNILKEFLAGHTDCVQFLTLNENDDNLYSCGRDSFIFRWNCNTGHKIKQFDKVHSEWVGCLAITKSGIFIFSCGGDKKILQWKAEDGKLEHEFQNGHKENVYCVKLSPDDKFLFTGSADKFIFCWDIESKTVLKKLRGHTSQVRSIDICPEFGFLLSGSKDKNILKWDMNFFRNFTRLQKALFKDEKETVGQILSEEIDKNNDINELQEFVALTSKAEIEQTTLMHNKIISLIQKKLNSIQKNEKAELMKDDILTYINKLNKISTKYNSLIKIIENHGFTEKDLENEFLQIKLNNYLQEELVQYKEDSYERIAQLKQYLDEFIEENKDNEDRLDLKNQVEETYRFFELEERANIKKFEGKIINGLKEGKVKEEAYDGSVFEGIYKRGVREGPGFLKTDKFSFEGEFKYNRGLYNTGKITHFDEEGNSFEKQFKGILNYLGAFKEQTIYGHGTVYFRNKWSFKGTFYEDEINGAINGKLIMENDKGELIVKECTYGYFKKQNLGRFTTVNNIYTCDFVTGEIEIAEK